jgi:hypothetical protein
MPSSLWWHNHMYDPFATHLVHALNCVLCRLLVSNKSYSICIYVSNRSKMVLVLSWFSIVTFKILLALFLLVSNDETLWPNLDVVKIGHAIIFLLKFLNFVVSKYINLSWFEQNYSVRVHVACQPIHVVTHIWIYSNFTLVSKLQSK